MSSWEGVNRKYDRFDVFEAFELLSNASIHLSDFAHFFGGPSSYTEDKAIALLKSMEGYPIDWERVHREVGS